MEKTMISLPEIKLIGITARTNNTNEMVSTQAKIGSTMQRYFHDQLPNKIPHRKKPAKTFCVYTNYESDFTGDYTYFIGEEVTSFARRTSNEFQTLIINPQTYAKFTTQPGALPNVVIEGWQKIWQMSVQDFGQPRRYHADFEVYDERATNPNNAIVDIYIGLGT